MTDLERTKSLEHRAYVWGLRLGFIGFAWAVFCGLAGLPDVLLCLVIPVTAGQLACIAVQLGARPWSVGRRKP